MEKYVKSRHCALWTISRQFHSIIPTIINLLTFSALILPFFFTDMKLLQAYLQLLFFLSLAATSTAVSTYAKTGCDDTCGGVMIPYPFGIGLNCSVNPWYVVECKSSTPYLSALDHLEILGVSLSNQTVTVNMPTLYSGCQNSVRNSSKATGLDLGGSPFLYSKIRNKIVFEGCGVASMMYNGSVVTGCSTACLNVTHIHRNKCYGISCCETTIPKFLTSYSFKLTGLEGRGANGGCGSTFLVDATSYDPFSLKNTSFTPVSLLWTLTDSEQVTCCYKQSPVNIAVDMFNGTVLNSRKCRIGDNPYLVDNCSRDPGS
ncbi:putative wall-associated receptor kinase, galacturonan-binding domain-containing protein [Helianthus anomalus]